MSQLSATEDPLVFCAGFRYKEEVGMRLPYWIAIQPVPRPLVEHHPLISIEQEGLEAARGRATVRAKFSRSRGHYQYGRRGGKGNPGFSHEEMALKTM